MNETELVRAILDALRACGILAWRNNQGTRGNVRFGVGGNGGADIIGLRRDGRFFAIEVKTNIGKLTGYQDTFLGNVRESQGCAGVARTVHEALAIVGVGGGLS